MKRLAIILTLASVIQTQGQTDGDTWQKVKSTKSGTLMCLWNEAYGIAYKDQTGTLRGVCVDILEDLRVYVKTKYQVDLSIEYREEKSFPAFLSSIGKSATLLGVSTVSVTEERKKRFQFSPYFISNPNIIVTHKDAPKLSSLKEIPTVYKGYSMKVIAGSTHKEIAASLKSRYAPDLTILDGTTSRAIFNEMRTNKALFTIIDFGEYLGAHKNKFPIARQPADLGTDDKLAFIMGKHSDWEPLWREFLTDEYRKSPRYRKIISENLGLAYLGMIQ
ncbi:MAG TPA: ABC transporter substrate-binding protein [Chryseosolibacter sp.]